MPVLEAQYLVDQFHRSMNHPVGDYTEPRMIDRKRMEQRAKWICEEAIEAVSASNLVDQADAMIDAIYFCLGTLVEMGVDASPIMEIVHMHNMKKVAAGKDANSKQNKPEDWEGPENDIWKYISSVRKAKNRVETAYRPSEEKLKS